MQHPKSLVILLLAIVASTTRGAESSYVVEATADRPDALYGRGEPITFRFALKQDGAALAGQRLTYKLSKDGVGSMGEGSVESSAGAPATIQASMNEPGFVRCEVTFTPPAATQPVSAIAAAGVDPERIKPSLPEPEDFFAYWANQKALLASESLKPVLTSVDSSDAAVEAFDVQVNCLAPGVNVSGYLARPKGAAAKSLPAILYPHSAGVRDSDLPHAIRGAKLNALAFDFNAHGLPNGKGDAFYKEQNDGPLKGYPGRGVGDREQVYFRGMYLRIQRALDFLMSLPEWDGRTLIVEGSSQGGGQALVAAALEPRVTLCLASVPAMCDHTGITIGRASGWPRILKAGRDGKVDEKAVESVRYYDAMNFATRIRCQTIVSVGFIDRVCAPTSVFAAYNNIPAGVNKQIVTRPMMGHAFPKDLQEAWDDVIRVHIAQTKSEGSPALK